MLLRNSFQVQNMTQAQSFISRSVACNGKLITQLRRQIGWTQRELAQRAGFSQRLIVKAEASLNIAVSTLSIISQTLTEGGAIVSTCELTVDPLVLAKKFLHSMYQRDRNVIDFNAQFISPHVVVHFSGDPTIFPFVGEHTGISAAREAFESFNSALEFPIDDSEIASFVVASTGQRALIWGETWAHSMRMPLSGPIKFAIKMDFKEGLLVAFNDRFDTFEGRVKFAEAI